MCYQEFHNISVYNYIAWSSILCAMSTVKELQHVKLIAFKNLHPATKREIHEPCHQANVCKHVEIHEHYPATK